jgi:hypothetical protein
MALIRLPGDLKTVVISGAATGAYASGDQIGVPVEIQNAVMDSGALAEVSSLTFHDVAKADQPVDVIFFSQQPSTGTDNAAWAPTAADLALILGAVQIPTTAYSDGAARSVASVSNIGLKIKAGKASIAQSSKSIWVLLVSRGTPNYGAAANTLSLLVGLRQD